MRLRKKYIAATATAALATVPLAGLAAPAAQASQVLLASGGAPGAPSAAPAPGHVILKAGSGTIALATTGVVNSPVYAGRYRASNHAEDWFTDHEPGGSFPGGRFGLFWAPGGKQTNLYVHGAEATAYLVNGASLATIFTAAPASGGYTALTYLAGGTELTTFELTYVGKGVVAFRPEGAHGPTADQLWKITG